MPPVCPQHSGFDARITSVESEVADHRIMIRKIHNRPPAWVTIVIGLLTFALGWSAKAKSRELEQPSVAVTATVNSEPNQPCP